MPNNPQHLVSRLTDVGLNTVAFFQDLTPEQWLCTVYSQGDCWTARQVLAHFVATEAAIRLLVEDIVSGGAGASEGFDIDAFNEREVESLREVSPAELLRRFTAQRQANACLVGSLQPGDLLKIGRHPFLGLTSVEEIIKMLYRHNQIHVREMRQVFDPSQERSAG